MHIDSLKHNAFYDLYALILSQLFWEFIYYLFINLLNKVIIDVIKEIMYNWVRFRCVEVSQNCVANLWFCLPIRLTELTLQR